MGGRLARMECVMGAGELLSGNQALDELRAEVQASAPWRLRVPPASALWLSVPIAHWKITERVELVVDPSLPAGSAVWLPPFRMPYRAFMVRAGSVDEAERWCGRRGISIGMREEPHRRGWAFCVLAVADYPQIERIVRGVPARDLAVVTLPGWPALSEPVEQTELELAGAVMLAEDWAPDIPGLVLGVS